MAFRGLTPKTGFPWSTRRFAWQGGQFEGFDIRELGPSQVPGHLLGAPRLVLATRKGCLVGSGCVLLPIYRNYSDANDGIRIPRGELTGRLNHYGVPLRQTR